MRIRSAPVADMGEKIGPVVERILEPGETLEGMCVGSQSGFMSGKFVVIAVTDRRLIVQEATRKQEAKGEPVSIPVAEVAGSSIGGGGGFGGDLQASIMNKTSLTIKVKTTAGEKLKLMVARGGGPLGGLMGGATQENGVRALGEWLARTSPSR